MQSSILKAESDIKSRTKVPVLKITINKRYNKPFVPNILRLDDNIHKLNPVIKQEKCSTDIKAYPCLKDDAQNISLSPKPIIPNVVSAVFEKPKNYKNTRIKTRNVYTPKFAFTRKGDLSRDQSRARSSAERIHYLYSKTKRDCHMLRTRLKALRERFAQEKQEIQKLRIHLQCYYKNNTKVCIKKISEEYLQTSKLLIFQEDTEEEDEKDEEYEKLLKKIRTIKQDISNNETLISEKDNLGTALMDT